VETIPIYEYQCSDCLAKDDRVAGLDDHLAICHRCAGVMLRLDLDIFKPYLEETKMEAENHASEY
jgi:predicted nucleic acid-binding Zn ribbon protein